MQIKVELSVAAAVNSKYEMRVKIVTPLIVLGNNNIILFNKFLVMNDMHNMVFELFSDC